MKKPRSAPKDTGNQPRAKMVARYKAHREATAKKLFPDHKREDVIKLVAHLHKPHLKPEETVKEAFKLLDAYEKEELVRREKRKTIIDAAVPVHALEVSFRDGVTAITHQEIRPGRGEEYFGKFLRSKMGSDAAAKELERLKRDGFTLDEVWEFQTGYEEFRSRQRKKL